MNKLPRRGTDDFEHLVHSDPPVAALEMPVRPAVGSVPMEVLPDLAALEEAIRMPDHAAVSEDHDPAVAANRELERGAAAESAVRVVMAQLGLTHPTRLSVWTMREIARLLDCFYANPEGEIKLGGQTLGAGFVAPTKASASAAIKPSTPSSVLPGD